MRLKSTRFFSIKYNDGAREHLSENGTVEDGLLLSPLTFDADVKHFYTWSDDLLTLIVGCSPDSLFLWSCG